MHDTIATTILKTRRRFDRVSDTARLDAELLLAHCLEKPRSYLYSWPEEVLSAAVIDTFVNLVAKRLLPTPIAYLLGEKEFYSLPLQTTPAALIPRPETELLVDTALSLCTRMQTPQILELGTGTGAISIAVKKHCSEANLTSTDSSADCLLLAMQNANRVGVSIDTVESDWFTAIPNHQTFDLILSNPPYIAAGDPCLCTGDLTAEPLLALSPGATGLEALQIIIATAPNYLKPNGYLVLEHGHEQAPAVSDLLHLAGFSAVRHLKDINKRSRLTMAAMPSPLASNAESRYDDFCISG